MIINGNIHKDERGVVRFVNDFDFRNVKRFYTITVPDTNVIRAWQGHKFETKYFYVSKGSFNIYFVKIDNWSHPSKELVINREELSEARSNILVIKPGYATGIVALENSSILTVFSDKNLDESKNDDYRWKIDYFLNADFNNLS